MALIIIGVGLICLGLLALALQRFYSCVPAKELKRLAARGDHLAAGLYGPVAYGSSLRLLLWLVTGLSLAGGLLLSIYQMPSAVAFSVVVAVLAAMVMLQSLRLTTHSARFAKQTSPALRWLLNYLHTPLSVVAHLIGHMRIHTPHSGLYEKDDLIALVQQQKDQGDNRISHHDLELLERAVQFDDRQAADIVTPMSRAKLVRVDDHIGPVLLGELHASGQNSFLVYEGTPDHVVGTLFLRDAVQAKEGGRVSELMHSRLCFVHEDFSLRQVLKAFSHTGQFMVVVINAFEEPVGVITLQQLLAQLAGSHAADDFDRYEDRTAVAAFVSALQPAEVPVTDDELPPEEPPSPERTEMVESRE